MIVRSAFRRPTPGMITLCSVIGPFTLHKYDILLSNDMKHRIHVTEAEFEPVTYRSGTVYRTINTPQMS